MPFLLDKEDTDLSVELVKYLDSVGEIEKIGNYLKTHSSSLIPLSSSCFPGAGGSSSSLNSSFTSLSSSSTPKSRVFHLKPKINVIALTEFSLDLARIVMEEPRQFKQLLQLVLYQLSVNLGCDEVSSEKQIIVSPEISGLAMFYEHRIRDGCQLPAAMKTEMLWSSQVMVVAVSEKVKYVSSASYVCSRQECEGFRDQSVYVKVFSPVSSGSREESVQCWRCQGPLQEQFSKRSVTEVLSGMVRIGDGHQGVRAVFRQEQGHMLRLGTRMVIVYTVECDRKGDIILEVASVEPCVPVVRPLAWSHEEMEKLFLDRRESPWSFVLTLAYILGDTAAPRGSFFHLRIGLLLSLVSDGDQRLSVASVGEDDVITPRIMRQCLEHSDTHMVYTGQHSVSSAPLASGRGQVAMRCAGQLDLCQGGVLYLGNINNLKASVRSELVREMESRRRDTAVWGWASTSGVNIKRGHGQPVSALVSGLQDVSSVFQLVVNTCHSDTDTDISLSSHCLNTEDSGHSSPITPAQLRHYIAQVRGQPVTMSEVSRSLIQRYFMASRRVRVNFPHSSLVTLLSLAENHARLARRTEVSVEDAVFACHYYEESVTSLSGYSHLNVEARPHVLCFGLDETLGRGHDRYMRQFQARLVRFVEEYSGPTDRGRDVNDDVNSRDKIKETQSQTWFNESFLTEE